MGEPPRSVDASGRPVWPEDDGSQIEQDATALRMFDGSTSPTNSPAAPPASAPEPTPADPYAEWSTTPSAQITPPAPALRSRARWQGPLAVSLAFGCVASVLCGVAVATTGAYLAGTILSFTASGLSVAALVFGTIAVFGDLGRRSGIVAIALSIVANPFVLVGVLRGLGG